MDALKLLGSLLGNNATSSGLGGQILGQIFGSLMGGGAQGGGTGGGGLTDILGGLMGGGAQRGAPGGGGGWTDMLSNLAGGGAQTGGTGGGLTDILGGLMGGGAQKGGMGGGSGAGMLGSLVMAGLQMLSQRGGPTVGQSPLPGLAGMLAPGQEPSAVDIAQVHQQALAFVKAMINAAKADSQIDAEEKQKIVSKLSDVGAEEMEFIRQELAKPLNFDFLAGITQDMTRQIYAVSLMAITLDTQAENIYMQQLAKALGLDPQVVNGIHAQLGVAPLHA